MFKNPFSFEGRIRRTEYGITILVYAVSAVVIGLISSLGSVAAISFVLFIPMIWFVWAQGAKRCHDIGNSGWYQLIPFYGIWMLFAAGYPGENEYGSDPKDGEVTETAPIDMMK